MSRGRVHESERSVTLQDDYQPISTGMNALDRVLKNIMPGDNIVWQMDTIDDFRPIARAFAEAALRQGRTTLYFTFGIHERLIPDMDCLTVHTVDPAAGFDLFTAEIHRRLRSAGKESIVIFDCLSDLPQYWYSDLMLSNFFIMTCRYVYNLDSVAYFPIIRHRHSLPVTSSIRKNTQVFIDVYRYRDDLYVHPLKVLLRYSPTMYLPHVWRGETMEPLTESAGVSEVVSAVRGAGFDSTPRVLDIWDRTLIKAQKMRDDMEHGILSREEADRLFTRLFRMVISKDDRILDLASRYLSISDILDVTKRMIGTGLIGGKAVGMLLARAILKKSDPQWSRLLEVHDSFFIGSDVFYTYTVQNGCWRVRQKQRDPDTFLEGVDEARKRMLSGTFPEFIHEQFVEMFDYYGQSPIIVRSSSLLEDTFGNAFAGKYESVFCVNQGTRTERLNAFMSAVRRVYASTMSREALLYRARRGLLDRDEQMALLVQRVSGSVYGNLFLPQIAGVGLSHNPYVWNEKIDPEAGMLRLVCGLGTRAVNRHDDDYTCIVALNEPNIRPASNFDDMNRYTQKNMDLLDLRRNVFATETFDDLFESLRDFPFDMVASPAVPDEQLEHYRKKGRPVPHVLSFNRLLCDTDFVEKMRTMLATIEEAYGCSVDTEFTVNFKEDGSYRINLVQCRPLQTVESRKIDRPPDYIGTDDILLEAHGAIIGPSVVTTVDRIVYVVPSLYREMKEQEKHTVARLIGRLINTGRDDDSVILLMGPGRWGSTMPSLGVPVNFGDINRVKVLCELVDMNEDIVPDISLGTHFFNDIVEARILYLAVFPHMKQTLFRRGFFEDSPNCIEDIIHAEPQYRDAIRVIDTTDIDGARLVLNADSMRQRALCYLDRRGGGR